MIYAVLSEKRTKGKGKEDQVSTLVVPIKVVTAMAAAQSPGIL